MTSAGADRIGVSGSLYRELRRRHPDVRPTVASKATLVATSHLVEDLVARSPGRCVLMSGFQHGRNWAAERDRYLELAGGSDVIAVFAGQAPPAEWDVDHVGVRLRDGDPLSQEWFVLALGPQVAVTLCGLDAAGAEAAGPQEGERLFEVIWSFDPAVARAAADVVVAAVRESAPERVAEVTAALDEVALPDEATATAVARGADHVLAGMLDRVERLRGRERRVEREANHAKTEFLSRMSHELRTPLNAILGFTQLLELDPGRGPEDRESLRHIAEAGRHLLTLVDEVLDISRIETGRLALSIEVVDVAEALDAALAMIGPLAEARAQTLVTEVAAARRPHVHADRQRLSQVLLNLLSNAVKYGSQGGRVGARVSGGPGDTVRIAVSDTGPGIPAEELGRLFVPFERLPSTAGDTEGTGLGLALAQRMVQAMGGRIEVDSAPGRGCTFTVALPAASPPVPTAGAGAPGAPERHRVLYIEDNLSNLRLVERILEVHADVELLSAARGGLGLELARERAPAVILLDLNLPDLSGLEVFTALRDHRATRDIPVVVVSSDATAGTRERLLEAGAAAFVTKPIDVRELLDTVGRLLAPG